MAAKGAAVGIDLGTTYSCVGIFQHGKVEIIANDQVSRNDIAHIGYHNDDKHAFKVIDDFFDDDQLSSLG